MTCISASLLGEQGAIGEHRQLSAQLVAVIEFPVAERVGANE